MVSRSPTALLSSLVNADILKVKVAQPFWLVCKIVQK